MADLLSLNAIKKLSTTVSQIDTKVNCMATNCTARFCRSTHETNKVCVVGGNNCCVCVPEAASKMVVEMWGGGGSGQGHCCMSGGPGGTGGSYGYKVFDLTTAPSQTLCICAGAGGETNSCTYNGMCGYNSCVTNCTTGYCLKVCGGEYGWNYCCCQNTNPCIYQGGSPYLDYKSMAFGVSGFQTGVRAAMGFGSIDNGPTATVADLNAAYSTQCASQIQNSLNSYADKYMPVISCGCFDLYRKGMSGWSECSSTSSCTEFGCCNWGASNGGAAYAGGSFQISCCNCGCAGQDANFPGGGSPNRNGGASMCCAQAGGNGLVIVSWN